MSILALKRRIEPWFILCR